MKYYNLKYWVFSICLFYSCGFFSDKISEDEIDKTIEFSDDYNTDAFIFVKQDQPLPLSVLSIYPELVTHDG